MRVFLDTNVLASALATRGLCADLLRDVLAKHDLIVSQPLLDELRRILLSKFKTPEALTNEMLSFFESDLMHIDQEPLHPIDINDKDDVVMLSSAINRQADMFVTGDKEALSLSQFKGMPILSPRAFLEQRHAQDENE